MTEPPSMAFNGARRHRINVRLATTRIPSAKGLVPRAAPTARARGGHHPDHRGHHRMPARAQPSILDGVLNTGRRP